MTSTCTLERRRERTHRDSWRVSVRDKMVRLVKRFDTSDKRLRREGVRDVRQVQTVRASVCMYVTGYVYVYRRR